MFDCMEALGMGPHQLYDVTSRGACMLRKASPFFTRLDPFVWTGSASVQCKWHPVCIFLYDTIVSLSCNWLVYPSGLSQEGCCQGLQSSTGKDWDSLLSCCLPFYALLIFPVLHSAHPPHSQLPVWAAQPSERYSAMIWYALCVCVIVYLCVSVWVFLLDFWVWVQGVKFQQRCVPPFQVLYSKKKKKVFSNKWKRKMVGEWE